MTGADTFDIVEKGSIFEIKDKQGKAIEQLYVGAGWDFPGDPVDLDLVAACLAGGRLTAQTRLVYFGDRTEPGIQLSEDNTTGEGDGDDENLVIDLSKVEPDVDSIAIGICAYAGADLSTAQNVHLRGCNGKDGNAPQVFSAPLKGASSGDTVLHAVTLKKSTSGWTVENVNAFYKKGNGKAAIMGFVDLFPHA